MRTSLFAAWLIVGGFFGPLASCLAQELQSTLEDLGVGQRWAYNDWDAVQRAAVKSKKPILALFR